MQPKSVLKTRKSEFDSILDDDETPVANSPEDASQPSNMDFVAESNVSLGFDVCFLLSSSIYSCLEIEHCNPMKHFGRLKKI